MKKIIVLLIIIPLIFTGCEFTDYVDIEDRAIVSGIGFDRVNEKIELSMEIVNTPDSEKGIPEPQVLKANGADLYEALNRISANVSRNLFYSHCAIVVLGENLTKEDIKALLDYCFENSEFTLLLKIVSAKSANELLNVKPEALSVTAYEVMSILNSKQKNLALGYKNSFVTVESKRDSSPFIFSAPFFNIEEEEEKKLYRLNGIKIYENNEEKLYLNSYFGSVYEVFSNSFKSGQITLKNGEDTQTVSVKSSSSSINVSKLNDKFIIDIKVKQTLQHEQNQNFNLKKYNEILKNNAIKLTELSKEKELDIFGILKILEDKRKETSLNDFKKLYKNSKFSITLDVSF